MPPLDENKLYRAALWYATKKGWPVIALHCPANNTCTCQRGAMCNTAGKHPRFHKKLLPHGPKSATTDPEIIRKWWSMWPDANVGIATGKKSFDVLDVDIKGSGDDTLYELIKQNGKIPNTLEQITGSGGRQIMFQPTGAIGNEVRFASGLDTRSDGGLVVVPPSLHSSGRTYEWEVSSHPKDTELAPMPQWLLMVIGDKQIGGNGTGVDTAEIWSGIEEGQRDQAIFRYACQLRARGMEYSEAWAIIQTVAALCKPPFADKDAKRKLEQAWKYPAGTKESTESEESRESEECKRKQKKAEESTKKAEESRTSLSPLVKDWILESPGQFHVSEIDKEFDLRTRTEKNNRANILHDLCKSGIVESIRGHKGRYQIIDQDCHDIDFLGASCSNFPIILPFGLHDMVRIMPGNIIVVAGEPNAGKTAFLLNALILNLIENNKNNIKVNYLSSEMGGSEFRIRFQKMDHIPMVKWADAVSSGQLKIRERYENFHQVLWPDDVNIIDFLEVHGDFWQVGGYLRTIHERLGRGIAIVALQKNVGTDYGLGGGRGLEKPRLYLALSRKHPDGNTIKIVKAKNYQGDNPNGKELDYKLVAGWKILPQTLWRYVNYQQAAASRRC